MKERQKDMVMEILKDLKNVLRKYIFFIGIVIFINKKRIDYTKESLYIMTVLYILFNLHQDVSQVLSMYKTINFNKREYQKNTNLSKTLCTRMKILLN